MEQNSLPPAARGHRVLVVSAPHDAEYWRPLIEHEVEIRDSLATGPDDADIVLVVIGRSFAQACREDASVEEAIEFAHSRGIGVIPILVGRARMPTDADLPACIRDLSGSEALSVDSRYGASEVAVRAIATAASSPSPGSLEPSERGSFFIIYRRDDSGPWADALARALSSRSKSGRVFLDVASQEPGRDYRLQISGALSAASDVVVVIGRGFLDREAAGIRRIDESDDQVRSEIRAALQDETRLHIVLIGTTDVPERTELPDDIAALTDTRSIHRFRSMNEADRIAGDLLPPVTPSSGAFGKLYALRRSGLDGLLERPEGNSASDKVLRKMEEKRMAHERHAEWIATELAAYGWTNVSERRARNDIHDTVFALHNERFEGFRLEIHVQAAAVRLDRRRPSIRRAGFPRWSTRDVFPVSLEESTAAAVMRLPANLVDAALDPGQYLDRVGPRRRLRRDDPRLRHESFLGAQKRISRPNTGAIEGYQRTRRHASARGGFTALRLITTLTYDAGDARGVAFHPGGEWLAIATFEGIALMSTRDWRMITGTTSTATWTCAAYSKDGRLALGSDRGQLSMWDRAGSLVADRIAPEGEPGLREWLHARRARTYDRAITAISWSPGAEAVACSDALGVWVHRPAIEGVARWALPVLKPPPSDSECGVSFIANRDSLLAYGLRSLMCVLGLPDLDVQSVVQKPIRRGQSLIADQTGALSGGPPFSDIFCAEPSPTGIDVACAAEDGRVAIYAIDTWDLLRTAVWFDPVQRGSSSAVSVVSFSPDGQRLAAISSGQPLMVGDPETLEPTHESPRVLDYAWTGSNRPRVAWSPDSTMIAVNQFCGTTEIWGV